MKDGKVKTIEFDNEHHPSSPINRAACRKLIFARLELLRGEYLSKKLTRVSESTFEWIESRVKNIIDDALRRHPTTGSTIYLDR